MQVPSKSNAYSYHNERTELLHEYLHCSRSLMIAKTKYDTTQRDCLLIVWDVLILLPYLEGIRFAARMDHISLKWILNLTESSDKLARSRLKLSELQFIVVQGVGDKHQFPDALSRLSFSEDENTPLEYDFLFLAIDTINNVWGTCICVINNTEDDVIALHSDSTGMSLDTQPTESEVLMEQAKDVYFITTTLQASCEESEFYLDYREFLINKSFIDEASPVGISESIRKRILYLVHHSSIFGHLGQRRMYDILRQTYCWPHMTQDVYVAVAQYTICTRKAS